MAKVKPKQRLKDSKKLKQMHSEIVRRFRWHLGSKTLIHLRWVRGKLTPKHLGKGWPRVKAKQIPKHLDSTKPTRWHWDRGSPIPKHWETKRLTR